MRWPASLIALCALWCVVACESNTQDMDIRVRNLVFVDAVGDTVVIVTADSVLKGLVWLDSGYDTLVVFDSSGSVAEERIPEEVANIGEPTRPVNCDSLRMIRDRWQTVEDSLQAIRAHLDRMLSARIADIPTSTGGSVNGVHIRITNMTDSVIVAVRGELIVSNAFHEKLPAVTVEIKEPLHPSRGTTVDVYDYSQGFKRLANTPIEALSCDFHPKMIVYAHSIMTSPIRPNLLGYSTVVDWWLYGCEDE
jgi:hypothetical protein